MTALLSNTALQRATALFCILLGSAVLAGWWLDIDSLKRILPELASMKFNTALGFVLAGASLWVADARGPAGWAGRAAAWALLALGAASALERLIGFDLGIDQVFISDPDTPAALHPGRMALATALGFVLVATALIAFVPSAARPTPFAQVRHASSRFAAYIAGWIGALGLIGYSTDVDMFYALPGFGSVALHTAVGFLAVALGLIAAQPKPAQPDTPAAQWARLIRLVYRIVAFACIVTGVTAFALLARDVQRTLLDGLELALESRTERIASNLQLRTDRSEIIASRPNLLKQLRRLASHPGDDAASTTARGVLASFSTHGFSHILIRDPAGRVIVQFGPDANRDVDFAVELGGEHARQLVWHDGMFHLRVRQPIADSQGPLGTVESEQVLPRLTRLMLHTQPPWSSTDFRICSVNGIELRCFPSIQHAQPTRLEINDAHLSQLPTLSRNIIINSVREGQRTLGVAGRVGDTQLIAVLDVKPVDIYAPVSHKFLLTLVLIAAFVGASFVLIRRGIRPLVARLIESEAEARDHLAAHEDSSALLRSVFADSPDAILIVDADGRIIEASPHTESLFGYSREQLIGEAVELLLPERHRAAHPGHRADFARQPRTRSMASDLRLSGRRADGSEFPLDVVLSPISGGGPTRTIAIIRDITERQANEKKISDALEEKTVLLQEIHHRVKNNLQVIASLLNLQAGNTRDEATRAALADSQGRVKSMALLHQLLYETHDFARVDLGDYLAQLTRHALASANAAHIQVELSLAPVALDLERAVPCGLLVNELVSNVCKHAFPDGRSGTLHLELQAPDADGVALLIVADNGVGLPAENEIGRTQSLGLQLIPLLADQLGAELKLVREQGARYEIRFKP